MDFRVFYNSVNITDSISRDLQSCVLTDRYGGMLDSVRLVINDSENKWCKYGMSKGDEILIKTDDYTTGAMYTSNIDGNKGLLIIDAVSLKPTRKLVKSKIWRHVRLSEILKDCAKNNGLTLKTYGISDFTYETLAQIQKTDLDFASAVCRREGYSVKVDDNCLIVFNEFYIENQDTNLVITPSDVEDNYSFAQSSGVNNITVSCYDTARGLIERTAIDNNIFGGSETINERVTTYDEAERFAYGYLRSRNKKIVIGRLTMPYNAKISAGTVFRAEGFQGYDDKYVVSEVSHNIKSEKSNIIVRKILPY